MFEHKYPRLTRIERAWSELRWALNPGRPILMTFGRLARTVIDWFLLGAVLMILAVMWYARAYPGEVTATDARLEEQTQRHLVYSVGVAHRGVEVRCLFVVDRLKLGFTLSC